MGLFDIFNDLSRERSKELEKAAREEETRKQQAANDFQNALQTQSGVLLRRAEALRGQLLGQLQQHDNKFKLLGVKGIIADIQRIWLNRRLQDEHPDKSKGKIAIVKPSSLTTLALTTTGKKSYDQDIALLFNPNTLPGNNWLAEMKSNFSGDNWDADPRFEGGYEAQFGPTIKTVPEQVRSSLASASYEILSYGGSGITQYKGSDRLTYYGLYRLVALISDNPDDETIRVVFGYKDMGQHKFPGTKVPHQLPVFGLDYRPEWEHTIRLGDASKVSNILAEAILDFRDISASVRLDEYTETPSP